MTFQNKSDAAGPLLHLVPWMELSKCPWHQRGESRRDLGDCGGDSCCLGRATYLSCIALFTIQKSDYNSRATDFLAGKLG